MRLHALFLAFTHSLALKFAPRTPIANTTLNPTSVTSSSSSVVSNCCFVVQDTINEYYWDITTSYGPIYREIHITSITTLITPFADTTITRYDTNIESALGPWYINTTIAHSAALALGLGPQPTEKALALGTGNPLVTSRLNLHSPAAFWVYTTVKIITVPPVTDSAGHVVCVTKSSEIYTVPTPYIGKITTPNTITQMIQHYLPTIPILTPQTQTFEINGVNSNAEAYFGGYNISSNFGSVYIATTTGYGTETEYLASLISGTETLIGQETTFPMGVWGTKNVWIRSNGERFTYTPSTTGVTISFPTPYLYFPPWAIREGIEVANSSCTSPENGYYGYVPQVVINQLASDPKIKSEYPWLSSCLPGGPSILTATCAPKGLSTNSAFPQTEQPVSDLTSSTISTVYGWESSYAIDASGRIISTQGIPSKTQTSSASSYPQSRPATLTNINIASIASSNSPVTAPIATAASEPLPYVNLPTTTISGTTYLNLSPTTMPLIPGISIQGQTTILPDGSTAVIITASTQLPLPPSYPKFSETIISSSTYIELSPTTIPIVPGLDIPGYTTVIPDGSTEVIISASTRIPLPPNAVASTQAIPNSANDVLVASVSVWSASLVVVTSISMLIYS